MKLFIIISLVISSAFSSIFITPIAANAALQASSNYICMSRTSSGAPDGDKPFTIIVKASQKSSFEDKGFNSINCNGKLSELNNYRQQICSLSKASPPSVQLGFANIYGVRPAELCQAVS